KEQAGPVHAELVRGAEGRDPAMPLDHLHASNTGVEAGEHAEREREAHQRNDESPRADQRRPAVGEDGENERARERRPEDPAQPGHQWTARAMKNATSSTL